MIIGRNDPPRRIVKQILAALSDSGDQYRIYFSGEADGNQTEFESLSNQLRVGVVAGNAVAGRALLHLVRMIVDLDPRMLMRDVEFLLEDEEDKDEIDDQEEHLTVQHLIWFMAESESMFGDDFDLQETFTGGRRLHEVDLWTMQRVRDELLNLF